MVTLYDHRGRPINDTALVEEPQTSKTGFIHREFANHPSRGLTPPKLAKILQDAEHGNLISQCELYEDMEEKDAHIYAEMQKRKLAVTRLKWSIKPPRNASAQEGKVAEQVQEYVEDIADLGGLLFDMSDAVGKSYSMNEIEWQRIGKERLPKQIIHRPASWFTVDPNINQNELLLRDNASTGQELWPLGWIAHVHKSKSGYVARGGIHRILAWPFLFKNYSVRDLAEFLEIYGLPMRLGKYPSGASEKEKNTLLRAVINVGHDAAGIIPQGMAIDFMEAAKGSHEPYKAMLDWCEASQSKAILGGTLTTSAQNTGLGSNLGDTHNEVRNEIRDADARQYESTLTRDLIFPLAMLNAGVTDFSRCPRFTLDTEEGEDFKLYSEAIPKFVDLGMRIPVSYMHEKLNIPEASDDEPVLQKSQPVNNAGLDAQQALTRFAALTQQRDAGVDVVDKLVANLEVQGRNALDGMINQVRDMLDASLAAGETLAEFADKLLDAHPDMQAEALTGILQEALAAAQLAGRYDINDEAGV